MVSAGFCPSRLSFAEFHLDDAPYPSGRFAITSCLEPLTVGGDFVFHPVSLPTAPFVCVAATGKSSSEFIDMPGRGVRGRCETNRQVREFRKEPPFVSFQQ